MRLDVRKSNALHVNADEQIHLIARSDVLVNIQKLWTFVDGNDETCAIYVILFVGL